MTHSTNGAAAGDFDDTDDIEETGNDTKSSFEEQVNAAASTIIEGEDGIWVLPEDSELSEEVAFAAKLEKRRRDTQSAAAKTTQELSATKERAGKLESKLKDAFMPQLTDEQVDELDDLKSSDPEAYRLKMNEYETAASEAFEEELADMGYDEDEVSEMATRSSQLTDFLADNPGLTLDDEVFENDLPPRLVKQLETGEITFEKFLTGAKTFLTQTTKVDVGEENKDPDLGKAGGGDTASDKAIAGDEVSSYKETIF